MVQPFSNAGSRDFQRFPALERDYSQLFSPLGDFHNFTILQRSLRIPAMRLRVVRSLQSNLAVFRRHDSKKVIRLENRNWLASGNCVLEGFFCFEIRRAIHFFVGLVDGRKVAF